MTHTTFTTEEDFLQAYEEYADGVFRHCLLRMFDRERSKEIVCETFCRTWLFIAGGNYVDCMKILLYRMANQIILETHADAEVPTAADHEVRPQTLSLLRTLSREQRPVCILHFVDGFSSVEIGEIIGGSAKGHAAHIRQMQQILPSPIAHAF